MKSTPFGIPRWVRFIELGLVVLIVTDRLLMRLILHSTATAGLHPWHYITLAIFVGTTEVRMRTRLGIGFGAAVLFRLVLFATATIGMTITTTRWVWLVFLASLIGSEIQRARIMREYRTGIPEAHPPERTTG